LFVAKGQTAITIHNVSMLSNTTHTTSGTTSA